MEKLSFKELESIFTNINTNKLDSKKAVIVFTEDSFDRPYSLRARSYEISSNAKVFKPTALGFSLFGHSLDGTDPFVRLDKYMEYYGNEIGWKVDYCYLIEEEKKDV